MHHEAAADFSSNAPHRHISKASMNVSRKCGTAVTVNKAFLSPHGECADFSARLVSRINAPDGITFARS